MTGADITYGQFMDRAVQKLTIAWKQLRYAPPTKTTAARDAILTFKQLGHALAALATDLTGEGTEPHRVKPAG